MPQSIKVVEDLQMAHRLPLLPGKCQNIHGHTWKVVLEIVGEVDENGVLIDYHEVKRLWREFLVTNFDHRLVLCTDDPLLEYSLIGDQRYPGLRTVGFQPTVENLAKYLGQWARAQWHDLQRQFFIELWEGNNNCATWGG